MQPHALTIVAAKLAEEHGPPRVLDVDHSIQVYKPALTGSDSPASYYIRPPDGMTAEEMISVIEAAPGYAQMRLSLVPIMGIDTFHQPLISADDFARKYFNDNQRRIVRAVGKSDAAILAMTSFIGGLKPPFDSAIFPYHEDFALSGYRPPSDGKYAEVKMLYKPADPHLLMKVEREVRIHLAEFNLGREVAASRHSTRDQAPELILSSLAESPTGYAYLDALAQSLPHATEEEIAQAIEISKSAARKPNAEAPGSRTQFGRPADNLGTLSPDEVKKRAVAGLADILTANRFAGGLDVKLVHGGSAIEVAFPRTASSLWLATSFKEKEHMKAVVGACIALRADPLLREGWAAHYRFDRSEGKLQIRVVDAGVEPTAGARVVPRSV